MDKAKVVKRLTVATMMRDRRLSPTLPTLLFKTALHGVRTLALELHGGVDANRAI